MRNWTLIRLFHLSASCGRSKKFAKPFGAVRQTCSFWIGKSRTLNFLRNVISLIICLIFFAGCGGEVYRHYDRADDYLQQDRIQYAIDEYEQAVAKEPSNLVLAYNLGVLYVRSGRMQDALELFDELHKKHPDNQQVKNALPVLKYNLGVLYVRSGRMQDALELFDKLHKKHPDHQRMKDALEVILLHQATETEKQGALRKAIQHYEQILTIRSENYQARYRLAHLLAQKERYSDSIHQLKILVDQLPELHSLHFELVTLYLQKGKWKEARDQLEKEPSTSPLFDTAQAGLRAIYLTQAVSQESAGNLASAAELYEHAIRHGDFEARLWNKLGQIFYKLDKDGQAEKWFRKVLEQEPENEFAHYYLGLIGYSSGKRPVPEISTEETFYFNAGQYVRKIAEKHNVPLELVMAIIHRESAMRPDADSGLAYGLMQLTPSTARKLGLTVNEQLDERKIPKRNLEAGIRYLRSLLDQFDKNLAEAVASYNCGPGRIKRLPNETKTYVYKVLQSYFEYVNSPKALQQNLDLLTENCLSYELPESQPVPVSEERPTTQALKHFQQCGNLHEAIFNIAVLYDEIKDYQKAIETYQDYLDQTPQEDASQAHIRLANNYLQVREYDKAREQLISLRDESAQEMLGAVELLSGKDKEALEHIGEQPLLSSYALLRLHRLAEAKSRLQSLTESIHTTHADAVLEYLQELSPYRARQQGAWVELFPSQPDFKFVSKLTSHFIWPVRGRITSGFGWRKKPLGGSGSEWHNGIDISTDTGTPVKAARAGTVIRIGEDARSGKFIVLHHTGGYESYYCHLSSILASQGDAVSRGQIIALSGTTGRATGPHLHFAVKKAGEFVDPLPLLKR